MTPLSSTLFGRRFGAKTDSQGGCIPIGAPWVQLRMGQSCGHIACCDSSPNRHASANARVSLHSIAGSAEPGEDWSWCPVDELAFEVSAG